MSDPTKLPEEERAREALREQADAANRLDPAWLDRYPDDAQLEAQPVPSAATRERLFSRKVLFGWAFAALVFVFIVRMVLPVVFETVKETVLSSMKASTSNSANPVLAPTPPATTLPPIPAIPAVPAAPTAVQAPERPEAPERPAAKEPSSKSGATTVQTPAKK